MTLGKVQEELLLHDLRGGDTTKRDAVCVCGLRERMRKFFAEICKNARSPASIICLPGAVSFSNILSTIILHYNRLSRSS